MASHIRKHMLWVQATKSSRTKIDLSDKNASKEEDEEENEKVK